jgi:hypothetical protein
MTKSKESEESAGRLQRFAEIYQEKMTKRPMMEIIVRYASMTEAHLTVSERDRADLLIESNRFSELFQSEPNPLELHPIKLA